MSFEWLRWHHGTCADPKWRVIASKASHAMSHQVTTGNVLAVWACMLECASQASPRGTLTGWCDEDIAAALDLDEAVVRAIHTAMQGKTLDGNALKSWAKRQPLREREDTSAADRKRAQRERERAAEEASHAASRHVTPRQDEIRQDETSHSVGKGEVQNPGDAPRGTPAPRTEIGTATGQAAKALKAAGITHVNPSHPALLRLLDAGVTLQELTDAAAEAVAAGKRHLAYVCSVVEGRRRDAESAGNVPKGANGRPVAGSGAHKPADLRERRSEQVPSEMPPDAKALAARLGIAPRPEEITPPSSP